MEIAAFRVRILMYRVCLSLTQRQLLGLGCGKTRSFRVNILLTLWHLCCLSVCRPVTQRQLLGLQKAYDTETAAFSIKLAMYRVCLSAGL